MFQWPDQFPDPTPPIEFDGSFTAFLEEMRASGVTVFAEPHWSLFEFCRDDRCIHFIRRGRAKKVDGVYRANREMYWEAIPTQGDLAHRLGPLVGIDESGCVVVCGTRDIRLITIRWLAGSALADTVSGIPLWDKGNSLPLQPLV